MAVRGDGRDEMRPVRPLDRRFAGGIDVGDHDAVGVVEAGGEGVEQRGSRREAVRLHDGDHLARGRGARRLSTAAISTGWWP